MIAFVMLFGAFSYGAPSTPSYQADLTIIPCVQSSGSTPSLYYSIDRLGQSKARPERFTKLGSNYEASVTFDQPHVWIKVTVGHCSYTGPVTLVSGRTRHLLIRPALLDVSHFHGDNWLYGSVPQGIGYVELRNTSLHLRDIATMDDGHFFFEYVPNGSYVMRFNMGPGEVVERPITITGQDRGVEFNLELSDLVL